MKIKVSAEIEIPEQYLIKDYRFESAVDLISTEIVHYAIQKHYEDALRWAAMPGKAEANSIISEHHRTWGDFCKTIEWRYEEMPWVERSDTCLRRNSE